MEAGRLPGPVQPEEAMKLLFQSPRSHPFPNTGSAHLAPTGVYVCVLAVVWMAVWAVCLVGSRDPGGFNGGGVSESASCVLQRCDWFEMVRVNAAAHSAKVVELETFRHCGHEQFKYHLVGYSRSAAWAAQQPVTVRGDLSKPNPAAGFCDRLNPGSEHLRHFVHGLVYSARSFSAWTRSTGTEVCFG
jgi:hypothetical protein